ncbi:hypothetical protein [Bacillus niameyensis]|uniref:hypothetical protein n=1 Tax=Bacillus niameyensis TaxID=1522308 RepID=UPI0007825D5C|nr:hypothetical protein [Bacillus niameyensis]
MIVRLQLFLKLWLRSIYSLLIVLSIPVMAIVIYNSGTYTIADLTSIIYEKAAPIWFIFILQWFLAIEFDSKFYHQLITYPIVKWKFLIERLLFATLIFLGLLSVVTVILSYSYGNYFWKSFVFAIPLYMAMSGFVFFGTLIGKHSLGGLLMGIFFWMFYLFGGALLKDFNVILLVYGSVERFVSGESGFWASENRWILYNRSSYIGIGVLLMGAAMMTAHIKWRK